MMLESEDDCELIGRILSGDVHSFSKLVNRYHGFAFDLAMKLTNNHREISEEITQDVFMKVIKHLRSYQANAKFSTWLYRIIYTTAMSELRKKKFLVFTDLLEQQYDDLPAESDWDVYRKDEMVLKNSIDAALEEIPDVDATLLRLYYLNEQSIDEIVSIVGVSRNTIKVRLFRARQKIKSILEEKSIKQN